MSSQIPIPLPTPQIFDPVSSIMRGFQATGQNLNNQTTAINNATLNQLNQARIQYLNQVNQGQNLTNQRNQSTLQYAAPQAEANVGKTQAETNLGQAQANFFPLTAKAGWLGAVGKIASAQAAADRTHLAYYQSPEGQRVLATSPQDQAEFAAIMQRMGSQSQGGIFGNPVNLALNGASPSNISSSFGQAAANGGPANLIAPPISPTDPSVSPNDTASALVQAIQQSGGAANLASFNGQNGSVKAPSNPQALGLQQSSASPPQPPVTPANNNIDAIKQAAQDEYYRKNLAPGALKQITYGNVLDAQLKAVQPVLADVASFAGLAGHAGQKANEYAQAAGLKSSPQYKNFVTFTETQAPLIANEIRRILGGSPTDKESAMLANVVDPVAWNKDPQQVYSQLTTLINTTKAVGAQLTKLPTQAVNSINQSSTTSNFDPASYYAEMEAQPKTATAMYQLLPADQRAALKAYHASQRGKNGTS